MEKINEMNEEVKFEDTNVDDISVKKAVVNESTTIRGVVTNCMRLNVRDNPNQNANIVGVLSALAEVQVDIDELYDEFYKVTCESGISGYCMKKYIAI